MSTEQEHEIVPAIRDWLAATSDVEIPPGASREEARRQAREFLAAIAEGTVAPDHVEVSDDFKDILWAAVEDLDERPLGQPTFDVCDHFYQFVAGLPVENDPFEERDEILHRVARTGWRSAPGGLEAALKARAAIWEHCDEQRHREVCSTAGQLLSRVEALRAGKVIEVADACEICARLMTLTNIYPSLVARASGSIATILISQDRQIGRLDDREHLKATTALAGGMAMRQLGRWDSALFGYERAESGYRRTAEISDCDRVETERLALQLVRGGYTAVAESAMTAIKILTVPRDRLKAQLILAHALLCNGQSEEARLHIQAAQGNPTIQKEPVLEAWSFMMMGSVLSYQGHSPDSIASFGAASAILERFYQPMLSAALAKSVGEHLGSLGNVKDAVLLYSAARDMYRRLGLAQQVGYVSVVLSELLMLAGRDDEAEAELINVIPLLEKFDLQKEGVTAIALLREARGKRRTDVKAIQALRSQLRQRLNV